MKTASLVAAALCALALSACVSSTTPAAPTSAQQTIANAVEDTISIGLVPVLTKNRAYLPVAQGIAGALGSFSGTTLTTDDISAFLAKTTLAPEDAKTVAGIVSAAWGVYQKRYQAQVGASLRPDVRLFLTSVSIGILNAISAVPVG